MIAYLETLVHKVRSQLSKLTANDVNELFERLSYLAYNFTEHFGDENNKVFYPDVVNSLDAVDKEHTYAWLYNCRLADDIDILDEPLATPEQEAQAIQIIEWASQAELVFQTEKLVYFSDKTTQIYLCAEFCQQHLTDLPLIQRAFNYEFNQAWKILNEHNPQILPALLDMFDKLDTPDAQRSLINTIVATEDVRAVDFLLDKYATQELDDINHLVMALGTLQNDKALTFLEDRLYNESENYIVETIAANIARYGEQGLAILNKLITSENLLLRKAAISGSWPSQKLDFVMLGLQDKDEEVRIASVQALIGFDPIPEIFDLLIACLHDKDDSIRMEALRLLRFYDPAKAVKTVRTLLQSDNRDLVFEALQQIGSGVAFDKPTVAADTALIPNLLALLPHSYLLIQGNAIELLGKLEVKEAFEPLVNMLKTETDDYLRNCLATSLAQIDPARAIEPLLMVLQTGTDFRYLEETVELLIQVGDPQAKLLALNTAHEKDIDLTYRQKISLGDTSLPSPYDYYKEILQNPEFDERLRIQAVQEMGRLQDKQTTPLILEILKDETYDNVAMRYHAIYSLGSLEDEVAIPVLEWLQRNDVYKLNRYLAGEAIKQIKNQLM